MLDENNSAIFRVATAFEAQKEARTVTPDAAAATRELGRERFYDAFAGRYGLPGNALSAPAAALRSGSAETESASPLAAFARTLTGGSPMGNRTDSLIAQQQEQIAYLTENDADPKAIRGAKAVLSELQQLRIEQSLYAQMDAQRDRSDRDTTGFGPFGAAYDGLSMPPSLLTLLSA